jgi:hypothetical protein
MSPKEFDIPIKHPEWLQYSRVAETFTLREKIGPLPCDGWMLVVSLKHPLRAIYGSDLKAAWALMKMALREKIRQPWRYLDYRLHRKQWAKEEELEELREIEEEFRP